LLQPLTDGVGRYVHQGGKIHTDDTPVPVLEPWRGKTRTARLWTYVRDDRPAGSRAPLAVSYRYSLDRKSKNPREHLAGYSGTLQADAYSGYDGDHRATPLKSLSIFRPFPLKNQNIHYTTLSHDVHRSTENAYESAVALYDSIFTQHHRSM
jgi:hypothetical protein